MSMHTIALTELEEEGLRAHGLDIGTPSQLSDAFRQGVKWALEQPAPERVSVPVELLRQGADLLDAHSSGPSIEQNIADELRALIASHAEGGKA